MADQVTLAGKYTGGPLSGIDPPPTVNVWARETPEKRMNIASRAVFALRMCVTNVGKSKDGDPGRKTDVN
jgi:hypothetical protein